MQESRRISIHCSEMDRNKRNFEDGSSEVIMKDKNEFPQCAVRYLLRFYIRR